MTGESVNVSFCSHIPNSSGRISSSSYENVYGRMESERVDGTQVAVVVSNNLKTNTGSIVTSKYSGCGGKHH